MYINVWHLLTSNSIQRANLNVSERTLDDGSTWPCCADRAQMIIFGASFHLTGKIHLIFFN